MRKVFLCFDPQVCFLGDTLLAGLWEQDDVDIYEEFPVSHARGGVDEGYDLPNSETKGYTSTPNYFSNPIPPNPHTREEILDNAKNFDFIFLLNTRDYSMRGLRWFLEKTGLNPKDLPLFVADGEDHDHIDTNLIKQFGIRCFFKRELVQGHMPVGHVPSLDCHLMPLPFAAFTRSYPEIDDTEKTSDIFLSLGSTHPIRTVVLAKVMEYAMTKDLRHWIGTDSNAEVRNLPYGHQFHQMLGWHEYITKQAQSEVTVVIRGHGRDTLHAWEAFSFATAVAYVDPGIYMPYPLENGIHCLSYYRDDCVDLEFQLDRLFNEPELRRSIAQAGKAHCRKYHTTKARVAYMLDVARKIQDGQPIELEEYGIHPTMRSHPF